MTPLENLQDQLSRWQPSDGPSAFTADFGDWTVRIDAEQTDRIGCLVRELSVTRSAAGESPIVVGPWARKVAANAVGLLEPLRVIEVDGERNAAILRSDAPARAGDRAAYYEAALDGRGVGTLRRYVADVKAGTRRDAMPFALTRETIAKVTVATIEAVAD
jgi:hypothetical protein